MAGPNNDTSSNGYILMRGWFNYAFENQGKVRPEHTAMYAWFVELNNRMGWAEHFYSPASQTMATIGIKSFNTYKKVFNDLVNWGCVTLVQESKNQWTACVIALSNFNKAQVKALDNALVLPYQNLTTHIPKQDESTTQSTHQSTGESTDSINKQLNNKTTKQLNQQTLLPDPADADPEREEKIFDEDFQQVWSLYDKKVGKKEKLQTKWRALKQKDRDKIMAHIPSYKLAQPKKRFRKNFETYLNNESWNDELITEGNETANRSGKNFSAGNASDGREDFGGF